MKKLNPIVVLPVVVLIVMLFVVLLPLVGGSEEESSTKSLAYDQACSVCGEEATFAAPPVGGKREYLCEKCYDERFGDKPTKTYPGLFD